MSSSFQASTPSSQYMSINFVSFVFCMFEAVIWSNFLLYIGLHGPVKRYHHANVFIDMNCLPTLIDCHLEF